MPDCMPARAVHPGKILRKELKARKWTRKRLSAATGLSLNIIRALCYEVIDITPDLAMLIGNALGTSAAVWLNLQAEYDRLHTKKVDR